MPKSRRVVAIGRHQGTEAPNSGASPGTTFLFTSLHQSLRKHFSLLPIPFYYYSADARGAVTIALEILARADACIFGLPPNPVDLEPFFLVRSRSDRHIPFIYLPLGEFPRGAWFYRRIHQYLRPGDLILFSSQSDRRIHDLLIESTPAKVLVQPFGIHVSDFRVTSGKRKLARRLLGIGESEVVFLYHGRITVDKNIHGLIGAFRLLAARSPNARLWIAGDLDGHPQGIRERGAADLPVSRLTEVFKRLVREGNIRERVSFWGCLSRSALLELLAAADIAITLTLNPDENFGYSVVEAMAAGLPVIGTDWGGLRDTIADGETGYRISTIQTESGVGIDVWQLVQRSLQLVNSPELRQTMRGAAVRRAERMFSLEQFVVSLARAVEDQNWTVPGAEWNRPKWSKLGKQLVQERSVDESTTDAFPSLNELRQQILRPYATSRQTEIPDLNAVYFLASDLFNIRKTQLVSRDPRYSVAGIRLTPSDREIVYLLKKNQFCDYQFIKSAVHRRVGPRALQHSLARLLKAGIIIQSMH